jgi:ubiquinone/menaquinone biosynthesis C-methylase UbiE
MAPETLTPDSKQAEKEYLRRSGGGQWELLKPFPPMGQTATEEHSQHLLDFAVLLRVLAPKPSDLVLDLGAGSCWVSDWLRRCGFATVAVDIAFDMLQLGSRRFGSARGLVVGDMERLPFADRSFDKACCLNAFHHIPDSARALREIRRVLKPNGVVFFSEPGVGHSSQPGSLAASRNYGVLEKEVLIDQFMDECVAAGFADVRLHPITNVMPLFVLNRHEWRNWTRYSASKRPRRAMEKMWRSVLELFGLRKGDLLFEEAFAIRLARELEPIVETHPIMTAHCSRWVRPAQVVDNVAIEVVDAPARARAASTVQVRVRLTNAGSTTWNEASGEVRLGVQLANAENHVIDRDYVRHPLPEFVRPGQQCEVEVPISLPHSSGSCRLKFDLVREGVHWFERAGSEPKVHDIELIS